MLGLIEHSIKLDFVHALPLSMIVRAMDGERRKGETIQFTDVDIKVKVRSNQCWWREL